MDNPQETSPQTGSAGPTRRKVVIGTAAVVISAIGGYYVWGHGKSPLIPQAAAEPAPSPVAPPAPDAGANAELMAPGPLGEQILGNPQAPITIIEYASMTCPHCAHFHETVYPELKKQYIDTGKVRFIFREFPLDALAAAGFMLARCAGPDKYFPMIETLFAQQKEWVVQKPLEPLLAIARQAGFTKESFDACLANQQVLEGIEQVRTKAVQKFQVNSTPTFFLNGKMLRGAPTMDDLTKQIEAYLKT
jgi:protein-disulfide isomerase